MTIETRAPQHDELSDELNAYLDGQLEAGRAALVEQHVAACAECARELEELRATRAVVRELPTLRAPRTFVLPAPEPAEPRWQRLLGWGWRLGSVASAACVLVAALSMNRPAPTSFSGEGATTSAAKNEAPAQAPVPPPQAAQERSALTARDSVSSGGAAAPAAAPGLAPAATQVLSAQAAPTPAPTAARVSTVAPAAPVADARVPAARSPATPWILAALLLGVVSGYVYTLDRRARTA